MKVKDLIKQLQDQDPELEIFISSDPEGNNIQEIPESCLGEVSIYQQDGRDIETWSLDWGADDACQDEKEWEEMKKTYPKGIILYP
mgnify:FL=1